jgi:phage tail protein X
MKTYTTVQGDTWDLIAYKIFGAEHYMQQLIEANPDLIDIFYFSAGVVITIPEISEEEDQSLLPIWRTDDLDDDIDEDDLYDPEWTDIDEDSGDDEDDEEEE